jgi:hypothetical protein
MLVRELSLFQEIAHGVRESLGECFDTVESGHDLSGMRARPFRHHRPVLFQNAIGPLADGVREHLPLRPLFIDCHLLQQVHHAPRNPHRQSRIIRDARPLPQANCWTSYHPLSSLRHTSVGHLQCYRRFEEL